MYAYVIMQTILSIGPAFWVNISYSKEEPGVY